MKRAKTIRINCISTPRNVSTALMYSFAQRRDTTVFDEPFYARYLHMTGKQHPGYEQILTSQPLDVDEIFAAFGQAATPVIYVKNMAHHMRHVAPDAFEGYFTVFLIRRPDLIISSFSKVYHHPEMEDIGLGDQLRLLRLLEDRRQPFFVIDSTDLLRDPATLLGQLCDFAGITFDRKMLSWEAGPRHEDGVWAPYWYTTVHRSTGFTQPASDSVKNVPAGSERLLEESFGVYEVLKDYTKNTA